MPEIINDSSNLEAAIAPFIDAANTTKWKHALNILYLNGAVLETLEGTGIPCLISQTGSAEAAEESIDLLTGKSQTRLIPLIVDFTKLFLPKILHALRQASREATENPDNTQATLVATKVVMDIMPELEKHEKTITKLLLQGSFTISDLIAAGLFKTLTEMRTNQTSCGIKEKDYEHMINALSKLDVIEPKLQISLCPKCANYQLTISTCPTTKVTCPKCGENWTTQTIYMFKVQLSKIKSENQDLPLFISSYLKFKTSFSTIIGEIRIYPNAEVKIPIATNNQKTVEIDVYIPDFHIGIECKAYLNSTIPMPTQRLNGMTGDIMEKHVRKYIKIGIERIFLVTNLPENHAQKLESALKSSLENQNIKVKALHVIPGKIDTLLQFLNKLASTITKKTASFIEGNKPEIDSSQKDDKMMEKLL